MLDYLVVQDPKVTYREWVKVVVVVCMGRSGEYFTDIEHAMECHSFEE